MRVPWWRNKRLALSLLVTCAIGCSASHGSDPVARAGGETGLDQVLRRDLTSYFTRHAGAPVRLKYSYLRRGPTITGVAYPKYYLWVSARDSAGSNVVAEGAVRVAEMDSTMEVTHFFPLDYIRDHPASLDSVFPQPVIAEIWKHLSRPTSQ